jgi:putative transcriptional regulator
MAIPEAVRRPMFPNRLKRPMLKVALLVVLASLLAAARSNPEAVPDDVSLAGQLLVASPDIGDPRFDRTVILVVRHDRSGAIGIIINRPVEEQPLASLMTAIGEPAQGVEGRVLVFAGGPVEPEIGFVLHSVDYHRAETLDIDAQVAMTSTREILSDIAHRKGPAKTLIAFGYSGWGPGQLENELAQHGWFTAPADAKLVFDEDREKVWQEAMARRMRPL